MTQQLDIVGHALPALCGAEEHIRRTMNHRKPVALPLSDIDFSQASSAFAVALHMQQPLIPAGGDDLRTAEVISNLKYMMDHPDLGDHSGARQAE